MAADDIQALINQGKYKEAHGALERMKDDERKYFLKGIIAIKQKNYDAAQEFFYRASEISKKPEYFRMMGIAHLEIFEMEEALEDFKKAISLDENDATSHFFISISYLFMDNPKAEEHMRKARGLDEKKTKQLLRNFYTLFIKDDPMATDAQKKRMDDAIRTLGPRQQ
jgi:tetratricopeptide (TPR) repeat protein